MNPKILDGNPFGKLSVKSLHDFEARIGVKLPKDYEEFLLENNGGKPVPDFFWIVPQKDGSRMNQFYGLHEEAKIFSLNTCTSEKRYGIPASMLPIGDDGLGNSICMGVLPDNKGNIFFLDHDEHPYDNPNSMVGITKLADSFTDFLNKFEESPE